MPAPRGKFVWYDVMVNDTKAATDFYKSVVGWNAAMAITLRLPLEV